MTQTPADAIAQLAHLYDETVATLRGDIFAFAEHATPPDPGRRRDGSYCYPELLVHFSGEARRGESSLAYGRLETPGTYATTVTRPALFGDYLAEQLELIAGNYDVEFEVRRSRQEMPFPYVLDGEAGAQLAGVPPTELARHFPSTDLALIGNELADGIELAPGGTVPLSLFDALRTDYSLARLAHYTGTAPEDFQRFVLFTNYHRFVVEFVDRVAMQ